MTQTTETTIPKFGLYGESSFRPDPGYVHIKDLPVEEHREGWDIRPHRHGAMFQLVAVYRGDFDVLLEEQRHSLQGRWVVCVPPGIVHGFRFHANVTGVVLTVAEALLREEGYQSVSHFDRLSSVPRLVHFENHDLLFDEWKQYLQLMQKEFSRGYQDHELMLKWLLRMSLMTLKRQSQHRHAEDAASGSTVQTVSRFKDLLEEHYLEHWSVQQYAEALHTSVSSLNRLCQTTLGSTTKNVIQDRLLLEAKRLLLYTGDSLETIAYHLGFKDPAYFSRFFKRLESVGPRDYRKQNHFS
jgi:AraC family transcriptional activator of pobA